MADEDLKAQVAEQNRRKLEEHLARMKKEGRLPTAGEERARKEREEREAQEQRNFRADWEAWKRMFGNRVVELRPRVADPHADYKLLGVSPKASPAEIRRAYYKLAKVHHPDQGGDVKKFLALMEAYQRVSGQT